MASVEEVALTFLFVLPGFVAYEAYRGQQVLRSPADFAWGVRSLGVSIVLWGVLGGLVWFTQSVCRLPVSSLDELRHNWSFGFGLVVGAWVLGTAIGRLERLAPHSARSVRRVLVGADIAPTPAPWYDLFLGLDKVTVWVITDSGPNYFGAPVWCAQDPDTDNHELLLGPPPSGPGEPEWEGPVLLDDKLTYLHGSQHLTMNDAGGPVWLASPNVQGIIICDSEERPGEPFLARHWPWMLALLFLGTWPVIGAAICTP